MLEFTLTTVLLTEAFLLLFAASLASAVLATG
jgi:hypothetical protein